MSHPTPKRLKAGVAAIALLLLGTSLGPAAEAETGNGTTTASLVVRSDSTAPDPTNDGIIDTYDLATYRLNLSRNGAPSVGSTRVLLTAGNGRFVDADATKPGFDLPAVCLPELSEISADHTELTCGVGPLEQGTAVALDYTVMASGEVANGDKLTMVVSDPDSGFLPAAAPELTIQGTSQIDVEASYAGRSSGLSMGGTRGHFERYKLDVRTSAADGKGGLPLQSASFTFNWAAVLAQYPGAVLVTNNDPYNLSGQQMPVGPNRTAPMRSAASNVTDATYNTEEWIIPNPGTWTAAYSGATDTSVDITVTGFSNEPISNRSTNNTVVTSGLITLFIPHAGIPDGSSNATSAVHAITAVPRGGGPSPSEYNVANNFADVSHSKAIDAAYRNLWSAFVNADLPIAAVGTAAIQGNHSSYYRPALTPAGWSSGGNQVVYPGMTIKAESVSSNDPARFTGSVLSTLTCTKFKTTILGGGDATAAVVASRVMGSPPLRALPANVIQIEYANIPGVTRETKCRDSDGTWTSTRPAVFNAVRAYTVIHPDAKTQASAEGAQINLVLQVPLEVRGTIGTSTGFYNTAVNGFFYTTVTDANVSAGEVDGRWLGTQNYSPTDQWLYNWDTNAGEPRTGDRVLIRPAVATFDNRVCDTDGSTQEVAIGDSVDYCLKATLEGSGTVASLNIVDETVGQPGSVVSYVPGSSSITVNGVPFTGATEPSVVAGELVWAIGTVPVNSTVEVRYSGRSTAALSTPGQSYTNTARVESPGIPDYRALSTSQDPNSDAQAILFRSGFFALNIAKSTSSPSVTYTDTPVVWDVHLTNQGESPIGTIDVIDILPFNGDSMISRAPGSDFSGYVGLTGAPTGTGTFTYTATDPSAINPDPSHESNQPGGSTGWFTDDQFGDAWAPASFAAVTAVRVVDTEPLLSGEVRTITISMLATGNEPGDIYTNDSGGIVTEGSEGPTLAVRSNDAVVEVASPGLAVVKRNGASMGSGTGDQISYDIEVSNTGALAEPMAVVTDVLRPGLDFVSASDGGTYDPVSRTVTWQLPDFEAGTVEMLEVAVVISGTSSTPGFLDGFGRIPNTASVRGVVDCVPPGVDSECDSTVTLDFEDPGSAYVVFSKQTSAGSAGPGATVTYDLMIFNSGDVAATNVTGTDTLPGNVTFAAASTSSGTISHTGGIVVWDVGTVAANTTVTATVTVTVDSFPGGA